MPALKATLLAELRSIDGVEALPSRVAGGTALFYRGKEFAHFHNDNELDLRLTAKVIRSQGLAHPPGSVHHRTRSPSSAWIELRFYDADDLAEVARLVRLAIAQR